MTDDQIYKESTSLRHVSKKEINWKIQNLFCILDSGVEVVSSKFHLRGIPDCYISLTFVLNKVKPSSQTYCNKCLGPIEMPSYNYNIGIRFFGKVPLRNSLFIEIWMNKNVKKLSIQNGTVDEDKYMSVTFNQPLYKEIDIKCNIEHYKWKNQVNEEKGNKAMTSDMLNNKSKENNYFRENLQGLYNNHLLADIIIYVNGREFKAHRVILATYSPVFRNMFTHNMRESHEKTIYIEKICPDIFEIFLYYMYTEKIRPSVKEEAFDLIIVADRYEVNDLKDKCLDIIKSITDVNNVTRTLDISYLINDEELKMDAFKYIADNLKKVKATEDYQIFAELNPYITIQLYEYILYQYID